MTPERYKKVAEVFDAARQRPSAEREAFLAEACGGDDALRAEVVTLLDRDGRSAAPIDAPAIGRASDVWAAASESPDALIGKKLRAYRVVRVLASGGMGTVYEAVQDHPQRTVALKVVKAGLGSASALRRLKHEAEVLGRLRHPNIAQVYEAGTADAGFGEQPFFAMELIKGRPLTEYAAERSLGTLQRLELLAHVCDAVHHAHQKGVIHRDLKPANILVEESGQPRVLDFGVARAAEPDARKTTIRTHVGQLVGTLAYMSPEQITADPAELDTRSDVYSLGVVLYELLCDELPYKLDSSSLPEAARIIHEHPPRRLSALRWKLRGDIETITLKALEKERERRYQSAAELANDVRRYLNKEPISARRPTLRYQLTTLARRNKVQFASLAVALLAVIAGAVGSVAFGIRASFAESDAIVARNEAQAAQARAEFGEQAAMHAAYLANIVAGQAAIRQNDAREAKRRLAACAPELRNWEWRYLNRLADTSIHTFAGFDDEIRAVAFAPDGSFLATSVGSGTHLDYSVVIWDLETNDQRMELRGHHGYGTALAIDPDGKWIACASTDARVRVWDASTGETIAVLRGHTSEVEAAAVSPDGHWLASGSQRTLRIWDTSTWQEAHTLAGHQERVLSVAWTADGRFLISGALDGTCIVWDVQAGEATAKYELSAPLNAVAVSGIDPLNVAMGSDAGELVVWNPANTDGAREVGRHAERILGLAFSSDGTRVAAASQDRVARLWDIASGAELATFCGHEGPVCAVAFHPDDRRIATGSADFTAKVWDIEAGAAVHVLRGHSGFVSALAFSPSGDVLVSTGFDGTVRFWDVRARKLIRTVHATTHHITRIEFSPNGELVAVGLHDHGVVLLDARSGTEVRRFIRHMNAVTSVSFSSDGRRLASAGADRKVCIWSVTSGAMLNSFAAKQGGALNVAFDPRGNRFATAGWEQVVQVREAETGETVAELRGHANYIHGIAFSPDGKRLASCSDDGTVRIWDATTYQQLAVFGNLQNVYDIAFNPDGTRLAAVSVDGVVRIWDAVALEQILVLRGLQSDGRSIAFSPDGRWLASGGGDPRGVGCDILLWEAPQPDEPDD